MEDNFKIPDLKEPKIKFVPRKPVAKSVEPDKPKVEKNIEQTPNADKPKAEVKPISIKHIPAGSEIKINQPKCSYVEPKWSDKPTPDKVYNVEVLKSGLIVEKFDNLQNKSFWLFGKLPDNDIVMAHPTISRYHAVLQYRPEIKNIPEEEEEDDKDTKPIEEKKNTKSEIESGWYLYDLNSTHGSFVNKMKIPPKTYVRVRVGYMFKFGASTRHFILQGPSSDEEAESQFTVTELQEMKRKKEEELQEELRFQEDRREAEGISWGMSEDADEETDLTVNPYAATNNEELFLDDPKKTLRGYFEREGLDLDYKVDEMSTGTFICRIELPITDSNGRSIVAEICHKGKKKDCVFQGALEACRVLDRHGVLRQAHHEPRKRKIENSDSSDDDDFYDRTGAVERKREEKIAKSKNTALSYEELLEQNKQLSEKITEIDEKIEKYRLIERRTKEIEENEDDLDDFISKLSEEKKVDKTEIRKLKVEMQLLKTDQMKLQKLINIARPVDLPPLKLDEQSIEKKETKKTVLPLFGKRGTFKFKTVIPKQKIDLPKADYRSDEEEVEENDVADVLPTSSTDEHGKLNEDIRKEETRKMNEDQSIRDEEKTSNSIEQENESEINTKNEKHEIDKIEKIENQKDLKRERSVEDDQEAGNSGSSKKRRSRVRIRGDRPRENVDIDDYIEMSDANKYSTWVPPDNQSGDGSTDLNQKYGY